MFKPLNYRQYASEMVMLFVGEPDQVFAPLTDLRNALARVSRHIEEDGSELVGLQNVLICMDAVLQAYQEHGLAVPQRLTAIHQLLAERYHELAGVSR